MEQNARIYVAGQDTLIGRALVRELDRQGYRNVIRLEKEPELTDTTEMDRLFARVAPEYVFVTAGKSGGIQANQKYPAEFLLNNLLIACHVIDGAYRYRVKKLLYLASSCSYPKHCSQPMKVESLLTGPIEPTNEAYAVAKIGGIKLCQAYRQQYGVRFISGIPADAFGPGDDFGPEDSHVIAAIVRKTHEAKEDGAEFVQLWGTGTPRREFMFADDVASACIFAMHKYDDLQPINLGGGCDLSIREVAMLIKDVVGYPGELRFDASKPDGMPVKLLDSTKLREMGWQPRVDMRAALVATYEWFLETRQRSAGNDGGNKALRELV